MFTGCITYTIAYGAQAIGEIAREIQITKAVKEEGEREDRAAAEAGRKRTLNEHIDHDSPLDKSAEDRLLRRTSELTGGIPVDVTPYLLHTDSFVSTEDEIWHNRSIIEIESKYRGGKEKNRFYAFEFDITVTFTANNQQYQMDLTAAACAKNASQAKTRVKNKIWQYAADEYGLEIKGIKKRKVKFNNTRKGNSRLFFETFLKCGFVSVFFQDIEPCYYQFDVEVEYHKTAPQSLFGIRLGETTFDTFNKVYRSDLSSLAAATIDVQAAIWQDARAEGVIDSGFLGTQNIMPIINFVRAAKYRR